MDYMHDKCRANFFCIQNYYIPTYTAMNRQNKKKKSEIADPTELLNSIMELSPAGIFVVDEEDRILAVNGSAKKMYGYSERAILSLKFKDLIPEFFLSSYLGYKKKEQIS